MTAAVVYALLWLSFGVVHSVLTIKRVKDVLHPWLEYRYRLVYNLVSVVHIAVVVYVGYVFYQSEPAFDLESWHRILLLLMFVGGFVITLLALRQYDLCLFSGITQWKKGKTGREDLPVESLNTGGLNSYIRHPLYTGMFMILWGNADSAFGLMTAVWGSLYLLIGRVFEEKKLIDDYGAAYQRYRESVPAFLPWKGRAVKPRT